MPPPGPPRRPGPARSSVALGLAGTLLIAGGVVFAVWAWVFTEPAAAVSADCELLQAEVPEFGEDLQALQSAAGDLDKMAAAIEQAADHFRDIGERLEDEEFGSDLIEGGDAADKAVERLRAGDLAGGVTALPPLMQLVDSAYTFLDNNCPNWLGPGQWTTPGQPTPSLPSDLPSLPELPSLPTDLPSLPELPSLPTLPELPELPSQQSG
jgi:hypothetical protein